jgi:hypothetical protein
MRRPTTAEWMGGALCIGLAIVLIARIVATPGERELMGLRATARWSFILFWLASTGHALNTLFGCRFQYLAQRARDLGLSFASAHLAHLGLVTWVLHFAAEPFPRSSFIFFGIGVFWTYLLALLSIRRLNAMLSPRIWRILRTVGVEYISYAFISDFFINPFQSGIRDLLAYLPFLALAIAGPLLRLAAAVKRVSVSRRLAIQ